MFWYQWVTNRMGNPTNYLLSEAFGNNQSAWSSYEKGKRQPNDDLLNIVNRVIPGSIEGYSSGPNGTKLWSALATNNFKELHAIKTVGKTLEREIVRFRLAATEGRIPEKSTLWEKPIKAFDLKLKSLERKLSLEIGELLSEKAISILRNEIEPYKEAAEYESNAAFLDFIMEDGRSSEGAARILLEHEYLNIELRGLKSKGSKLDKDSTNNLDFIRNKLGLSDAHQADESPI